MGPSESGSAPLSSRVTRKPRYIRRWLSLCCSAMLGVYCAGISEALQTPSAADIDAEPVLVAGSGARDGFVGDAACLPCHQTQSASYLRTAHHLTSQPADRNSILGSFAPGSNTLMIAAPGADNSAPRFYFTMVARKDGVYQTAVAELNAQKLTRSERIDVVVGSGVRGQTYLYWHSNRLYELPVSYWTEGRQWINSPGYQDGTANFGRRADPRCMECHTTYIRALSPDPQTNLYEKSSLAMGISCETCHGPGAGHVALEKSPTRGSTAPAAILNPVRFTRDRQVDLCGLCHNGTQRQELLPAFSYLPGRSLDEFFAPAPSDAAQQLDVHGNQVGLLKLSRCYLSAPGMTCSTCHDVHAPELSAASYSSRCLRCHNWQSCGVAKRMGHQIVEDCVDCHMPLQQTTAIVSVTAGRVLHTSIRNHRIGIYHNQ